MTLYGTLFEQIVDETSGEQVVAVSYGQQGMQQFYRFILHFTFSVNGSCDSSEMLKGIFTREPIYENVVVGQLFPFKRTSYASSCSILK